MTPEIKKRILIIEDHRDMLIVLHKYLEEQDFEVIEAQTGEIGIQKFDSGKPDLVLLDIMLPGISGLDVLKHIKLSRQDDIYVPVIIITAKNDISDIVTGLEKGADDYIIKPFHFDELIARIHAALRLKKLNELLIRQSRTLEGANKEISGLNHTLLDKNKELRKNIYGLHSLFELSMELSSILDIQDLISSTLLTTVGQYSCRGAFYLQRSHGQMDHFEVFDFKGDIHRQLQALTMAVDDTIIDHFKIHPEPTLLNDIEKKVNTSSAFSIMKNYNVDLLAPIMQKSEIEGLICFVDRVRKTPYEERELQQITILSNIISIAIKNAALYQEVEELSYTDGMTALHNYRYFEMRLKEEVTRHKRTKSGLSLLILDVDYFKNFNDTNGHQAGDDVLRQIAHILAETVRENDIVARYGGEEFAVILPAVEKDGAIILAERIRENIEKATFPGEEKQPNGVLTVSIGEASMPGDSEEVNDLIYKSDLALYAAKESGRNQVAKFSPDLLHKT